jgi:hypothetical protein
MDKVEAMVLAKNGIRRSGAAVTAAQPNGAPVASAEEKPKKAAPPAKPAN